MKVSYETDLAKLNLGEAIKKLFKEGKEPELKTEMDIWKVIESLGGYIFYTEHEAAHGRISLDGESERHLQLVRKVSELLVDKLKKEYNIIPPREYPACEIGQKFPPAPEGKIYYWDWYLKMSNKYCAEEFQKIICSACPLTEKNPIEAMRGRIPCDVFPGIISCLDRPYECAMIGESIWTEEELFQKIREKSGEDTLKRFKQKAWLLEKN